MNRNDLDERGQKMLWISWSRLLEWEKCAQRLKFHMAGEGAAIKEGRNFVSGTVADRAMRKWLEQDSEQLPGQMNQYVDELWDKYTINSEEYSVTFKGAADQKNAKDLAHECVAKLEPFLIVKVLPYDYMPEWRFQARIRIPDIIPGLHRSIVLNGGADILVREPDGNHFIYDLKTTRNEKYVFGSTLAQLIYYQIALNLIEHVPYENIHSAFLTPVCKTQYHGLEVESKDRRVLMSKIVTLAQSLWRDDAPKLAASENECYFCDCKQVCPRFAVVNQKAANGKHVVSFEQTAELRKDAKERTSAE